MNIRHARIDDAPALAHTMIEAIRGAFKGRVPDHCLNWITHDQSAANWRKTIAPGGMRDADCLLVATDHLDQVIGFALVRQRDDPVYRAELQNMCVDPSHQRSGVGRQLLRAAVEHLAREGIGSMSVRVMTVNPNRGFYERMGAAFLHEQPYDWGGITVSEAVYGWLDTRAILNADFA